MKILPVTDPSFKNYGQVLTGYDLKELLATLDRVTPCPAGVDYVPEQPELQALPIEKELRNNAYGGMPIQLGWCNGHNTKMNCLEYHRDSELNVGTEDFILLLAKREELEDGVRILPGKPHAALLQSFGDHRVAMSFALTGLRTEGVAIKDPLCCRKTFAEYFRVLEAALA